MGLYKFVIGCCSKLNEDTIDIIWYEGSYSTSWKPWKIRDPRNRRKIIEWTNTIPKSSIILFAFTMTARKHLKKVTIEKLKTEYLQLKQKYATTTE